MSNDLSLRCRCGAVRGTVSEASPSTTNRAVCYCDDCQAFARYLDRPDLVDARGGTEIIQVAPGRVRFTQGSDQIRTMRLSSSPRALVRCYTDCCRTPAGNMLPSARSPFVGLVAPFFEPSTPLDAAVGPTRGSFHGRFAVGGTPPGAAATITPAFLARSTMWIAGNVAARRHRGSPYWNATTGEPLHPWKVLSVAERDRLRPA